jgi:hypothetical protein
MNKMLSAKSCFTCFFGGKQRSPECAAASTAVCCEEWTEPKEIRVKATVEFEIDLREIAVYYGENLPAGIAPKDLDNWFRYIFHETLTEYLAKRLEVKDDLGTPKIYDLTDVEICYETEEQFRIVEAAQQREVIVA